MRTNILLLSPLHPVPFQPLPSLTLPSSLLYQLKVKFRDYAKDIAATKGR